MNLLHLCNITVHNLIVELLSLIGSNYLYNDVDLLLKNNKVGWLIALLFVSAPWTLKFTWKKNLTKIYDVMLQNLTNEFQCSFTYLHASELITLVELWAWTRMHSSRMRSVCCSGRRGGCLPIGGVVCTGGWWVGGVCPLGGVCPRGVSPSLYWAGVVSAPVQAGIHTPPPHWTKFLTHACENITFPQLRCGR